MKKAQDTKQIVTQVNIDMNCSDSSYFKEAKIFFLVKLIKFLLLLI